jgi:hypothetical protein
MHNKSMEIIFHQINGRVVNKFKRKNASFLEETLQIKRNRVSSIDNEQAIVLSSFFQNTQKLIIGQYSNIYHFKNLQPSDSDIFKK